MSGTLGVLSGEVTVRERQPPEAEGDRSNRRPSEDSPDLVVSSDPLFKTDKYRYAQPLFRPEEIVRKN